MARSRAKRQKEQSNTKNEADDKKGVNKLTSRKSAAPEIVTRSLRGNASTTPGITPNTRNKRKVANVTTVKQVGKSLSASNKSTPKKKVAEVVKEDVGTRATRSRVPTASTRKTSTTTDFILPPVKRIRTRSMQRKRTETPKKKALVESSSRNNNTNAKKKETEPVKTTNKNQKNPTPIKAKSKVKTKAKKVVIKKTLTPKADVKKTPRKSVTRKAATKSSATKIPASKTSAPKAPQRTRGRRSTQRSEAAQTPAVKKSVTPASTRPRRRMHKNTEEEKKEDEVQMETNEGETSAAEAGKGSDQSDSSNTGESKIVDPQEETKADQEKVQTNEVEEGTSGPAKRKLEEKEEETSEAKKVKLDDKEADEKGVGEIDGTKEEEPSKKEEPEVVKEDKPSEEVVNEVKEKETNEEEEKMDVEEAKVDNVVAENPVEKKEEKGEKNEPETEKEVEKDNTKDPTVEPQNNGETVLETPPEKLLAAEDGMNDEKIVEDTAPTTNGVAYEAKESPVLIGRRKLLRNAQVKPEDKNEDAKKCNFSVISYSLQGVEHDNVMKEMEKLEADIVCFQQVDSDYYTNTLQPNLKSQGFVGFYHEAGDEQKGLATFHKGATFEFVNQKACDVHQLVKKEMENSNLEEDVKQALKSFLSKAASALYVKFKSTSSQKTVCVCNTSLLPSDDSMHALQLAVLVKELTSQSEGSGNPHLLCGVLNLEEKQPGFQVLKDGYLSNESIEDLQTRKDVPIPDKENGALINLLWKCFQHPSSSFKSSYSVLLTDNLKSTVKNSLWHSSNSLRVLGVLDFEADDKKERNDDVPLFVEFDFN